MGYQVKPVNSLGGVQTHSVSPEATILLVFIATVIVRLFLIIFIDMGREGWE